MTGTSVQNFLMMNPVYFVKPSGILWDGTVNSNVKIVLIPVVPIVMLN